MKHFLKEDSADGVMGADKKIRPVSFIFFNSRISRHWGPANNLSSCGRLALFSRETRNDNIQEQAGAELGQAQLKLEMNLVVAH